MIPFQEYAHSQVGEITPLVSVLMPTYNHQDYIQRAIEGVIRQRTTFPIELIIAEDCSTDDTRAIVAECQTQYPELIRMITSEKNVGIRLNGLRAQDACRGKYVAPCDGDDYWHDPEKLQLTVDYLESNSDVGLVYTNADTHVVATGERKAFAIQPLSAAAEDNAYVQLLLGGMTIWPLTVLVRCELLDRITRECPEIGDISYAMGDTQRYLEIAQRSKIHYIHRCTATRNLLPESTTRSRNIHRTAAFAKSTKRLMLHYLEKYPLGADDDRRVRQWVALRGLQIAYRCRDKSMATEEMAALRSLGGRISWKSHLRCFGSRNAVTHALSHPPLCALGLVAMARRGMSQRGRSC